MTKSKIGLVCISLLLTIRLAFGHTDRIVEGTRVRLTIPTIDYPEHTDSQTVIKRAEWEVRVKGYIDFIPGEVVEVEGVVDERGRVVESRVISIKSQELGLTDYLLVQVSELRHSAVGSLQKVLPEPHASLAIGVLLGVKRGMGREFYDQLVSTGTLHIIAASGYNVTVVAGSILALTSVVLPRYVAIAASLLGVVGYVLIAGAGPAIVRAGVMGSLSLIGVMLGRMRESRQLLWVTAWVMLMVKPSLISDIGFQLSLSATLGLMYLVPVFDRTVKHKYLSEYLYPTLAATVATAPVIWWHFGRLSLIGLLVNIIILPVVPIIMFLSALTLVFAPASYLLYVPLWWMVWAIRMFG